MIWDSTEIYFETLIKTEAEKELTIFQYEIKEYEKSQLGMNKVIELSKSHDLSCSDWLIQTSCMSSGLESLKFQHVKFIHSIRAH